MEELAMTTRTLYRWEDAVFDTTAPTLVEQTAKVLAEVFTAEGCVFWLLSPNKLLQGRSAAQAWVEGDGDKVLALADALASGAVM